MKLWQAFKMAFRSIWGNKGRSVLTMLGIIIGIAAVMTIVSIMQGSNRMTMEMYEAMGTNKIEVYGQYNNGRNIYDELYEYCMSMPDLVDGITPQGYVWANLTYGLKSTDDMEYSPSMYFISHQYALCNNFQIARGRDISKIDIDNYNNVVVFGSQAAQDIFDLADPVGETVQINGEPFTVIGVYAQKDEYNDPRWSYDNVILLPYTAARTLGEDTSFMYRFTVKAKNSEAAVEATTRLIGFLTGLLGDPNGDWNSNRGYFDVTSQDMFQNMNSEYANTLSMVLGGIAGISLLVGGIGIMNIMLVTVTERTREIGIRRAIGARRKSIVTQFLIESGVICGIGGIFGAGLGTILTMVGSQYILEQQMLPTMSITLFAVGFAVVLGIVFGLYPAIKAAGLQPVVALRAD